MPVVVSTVLAAPMRENALRLATVLVSSVLTLLAAEIALRTVRWGSDRRAPGMESGLERSEAAELGAAEDRPYSLRGLVRASPHPGMVFELKPNLAGTFRGRRLETNSHGLRDREYTLGKDEGTRRIVGVGDSVMFGWGVGQGETYLDVLERRLADEGPANVRFEVLNFAVPGYNTAMEVAAFEHKALAFEPDLVVLHFVPNDFRLPHFMQAPADVLTWRRSYLFDWVASRLRPRSSPPGPDDGLLDHGLDALPADERPAVRRQYRHLAGEDGFRRATRRLAELTRARSVPVVVVRLSARHERQGLVEQAIDRHGFHSVTAGHLFQRHLRQSGLPPGERGWREAFWVRRRDSHPNALGHELFASALWDELVRRDYYLGIEGHLSRRTVRRGDQRPSRATGSAR